MLYVVGTPLGNLGDLSPRAAKTIADSDIILAEDTRSAAILLNHIRQAFNLTTKYTKIISYYKETEFEKLPEILDLLDQNQNVAIISEAGMPLLSDPGYLLVKTVIKKKIPITVIPSATAYTTALAYSGFNQNNVLFLGFMPKSPREITRMIYLFLQMKKNLKDALLVFYDSPRRVHRTLEIIDSFFPKNEVIVAREMTKFHEEILRGKAKDLMLHKFKGEVTVVVS